MRHRIPAETSRRSLVIVAVALFLVSCGYNFLRYEMTDDAVFGGDTWYYQSIAVNLVHGDGYKLGALHEYDVYKFVPDPSREEGFHEWLLGRFQSKNYFDFYGSPGLPLYLASIYKLVGIHPAVVKYTNVFWVAMAAALIPVISARMWRRYGLATGTIAGLIFLFFHAPDPSSLLGEPLTMFFLALWGTLFTWFERQFSILRIVILGVVTALLILVKSYALLVFMTAAFIAWKHRSRRQGLVLGALYVAIVVVLILPWSLYATSHSDRVVVISTQADNLIMDGNNEDTLHSGGWSALWRKKNAGDPKYLYNRLADSDMSTLQKVGAFYRENWRHVPMMFVHKLHSATGRRVIVMLILAVFVAYHVVGLRRNRRLRRAGQEGDVLIPVFPLFMFVVWLSNALIGFGLLRYTLIFLPFMLITVAYSPLEFRRILRERRG